MGVFFFFFFPDLLISVCVTTAIFMLPAGWIILIMVTPDLNFQHQSLHWQFYTSIQIIQTLACWISIKKYLIFSPLMLLRGWIFMFSQTSWPLLVVILVCQYFQLYSRYFMISTTDFHPISWTHSCFQEGWCFSAALMINNIFSLTNSFECRFDLLASSNPFWASRQQKNCLKKTI